MPCDDNDDDDVEVMCSLIATTLFEVPDAELFDVCFVLEGGRKKLYGNLRNLKACFGFFEFFERPRDEGQFVFIYLDAIEGSPHGLTLEAVRYCLSFAESAHSIPQVLEVQLGRPTTPKELEDVLVTLDYLMASKSIQKATLQDERVFGVARDVIASGDVDRIRTLLSFEAIRSEQGEMALIQAIYDRRKEFAEALIECMSLEELMRVEGVDGVQGGRTALFAAIRTGQVEIAEMLIQRLTPEHLMHEDSEGNSALILAIHHRNKEIAEALIERMSMSPEHLMKVDTLLLAIRTGQKEIAESLSRKVKC